MWQARRRGTVPMCNTRRVDLQQPHRWSRRRRPPRGRAPVTSRQRSPADRRTHLIHLTAEGRRVLARVLDVGERENARTFGVLDADEREQVHVLLERVAEANA